MCIYIYLYMYIWYPSYNLCFIFYCFFAVCMQQPLECACGSAKQRSNAFMLHESQQSVDIDRVQLSSFEADGSLEACWTLRHRVCWRVWIFCPSTVGTLKQLANGCLFPQHGNSRLYLTHPHVAWLTCLWPVLGMATHLGTQNSLICAPRILTHLHTQKCLSCTHRGFGGWGGAR